MPHFWITELALFMLSAKGKKVIQQMAKGEKVSHDTSGLSKREWNELMSSFDFKEKIV